jgi:hypothetical protein
LPGGALSGPAVQGRWLAPFALVLAMSMPGSAHAGGPQIPGTGAVVELDHAIELSAAPEGATLYVTRTLFNAAPTPAQIDLNVPLPCTTTIDRVAIEEHDEAGQPRWRAAELLDANDAARRWQTWLEGPGEDVQTAVDADTALHVERDDPDCNTQLSIYPIPPMHTRKVSYRVFVPSSYVDGVHQIELPSFDAEGEVAKLNVAGWKDPAFVVEVDGAPLGAADVSLLGDQGHAISLQRRDAGLGFVRAADLDLAGMVSSYPAATARLEPDEDPNRLLAATFEPPRELASLPPVRRVVVLIDASRSFQEYERAQLQQLAVRYLELLDETMSVEAEVVLFDRRLRRVYHDFVPAKWIAEDLDALQIDADNGSDLDLALAGARELLASPTTKAGADWILVLSDLFLRSDFPLEQELAAAASSPVRMHVVAPPTDKSDFHPGRPDEAWTMIAREAGGMLWYTQGYELDVVADELIHPTRIWSLRLELALADDSRRDVALADWHDAGETYEWLDSAHEAAPLERAAFVGEVWGQRRAWTAAPTDDDARRTAALLATHDEHNLSKAVRSALANYAAVLSPFTSAWAVASFGGPAAAPTDAYLTGGFGGRGISVGCGGAIGSSHGRLSARVTVEQLVRGAIANCPDAAAGQLAFETTDTEIVRVVADDSCIREQIWALDLSPTDLAGRHAHHAEHQARGVLGTLSEVELGYRDLTMPTPNITTNMASGMK